MLLSNLFITTLFLASKHAFAAILPGGSPIEHALSERDTCASQLTAADCTRLQSLGVRIGYNDEQAGSSRPWLGSSGRQKITFSNPSGKHIILVMWGRDKPWVNSEAPEITVSLAAGTSITISIPEHWSGGFAGLYPRTVLSMGMIKNTWGEITPGIFDIDRTIDMSGNGMTIASSSGKCVADMTHCAFVCKDGEANSCQTQVTLVNCEFKGYDPGTTDLAGGCLSEGSLQVRMLA